METGYYMTMLSRSDIASNCNVCIKNDVCKYIEHVIRLLEVGTVGLACKSFFCKDGNAITTPVEYEGEEKYKNMSVDEVSKALAPKPKKNEHDLVEGKCEFCGKEHTAVVKCDKCGKMGCTEHFEFETEIDINGGDSKEVFVCPDCRED